MALGPTLKMVRAWDSNVLSFCFLFCFEHSGTRAPSSASANKVCSPSHESATLLFESSGGYLTEEWLHRALVHRDFNLALEALELVALSSQSAW